MARNIKILSMIKTDQQRIETLNIPSFETTKGTTLSEQRLAVLGFSERVASIPPFIVRNDKVSESNETAIEETHVDSGESSVEEPYVDSGSEYIPSSENDTDEDDSELPLQKLISFDAKKYNTNTDLFSLQELPTSETRNFKINEQVSNSLMSEILSESETSSSETNEQTGVSIDYSKKNNNKRVRDKEHCCYFCNKLYKSNLARHYKRAHSSEKEVIEIECTTNAKVRKELLLKLIRCGDFYHNCEVLRLKKGNLILSRRPSKREAKFFSYQDYGPCPQCLGFLLKKHIWHHLKYKCYLNSETNDNIASSEKRSVIAESTALLNGILSENLSTQFVENIVNKFKDDNISRICKNDSAILKFGAFMFEKYDITQAELIRQSMRQLGRLILELRKNDKNEKITLSELLSPENFDKIVLATKQLCVCLQEVTKRPQFTIPSLALKLGYSLKKCCAIERGQALRKGDLTKNKKLLSFLALMKIEWCVRISSNAKATLEIRKLNNNDLLPLTSDLLKLRNFLDLQIEKIKSTINRSFSKSKWTDLASLTLVRIILFNKRRSGEASKITLDQFKTRPSWKDCGTEEVKNSLTSFEQKLASSLSLVQVVGKRGRRVPIILSKEITETLDELVLLRIKAGVKVENPYIFAIPGTDHSFMRGHDAVKKWCSEANLQSPELVTGTRLRKYVATVCQIFDLTENEQDWLARHLGHDIRVHREFYRLQENAVELTKISRLLLAVENGEVGKFSGQKLKDINIADLPALNEDEIDDGNNSNNEDEPSNDIVADFEGNEDEDYYKDFDEKEDKRGKKRPRKCSTKISKKGRNKDEYESEDDNLFINSDAAAKKNSINDKRHEEDHAKFRKEKKYMCKTTLDDGRKTNSFKGNKPFN